MTNEDILTAPEYGRCPVCDEASFPIHALTPCGHDVAIVRHPFTETGEVYSWTRTHSVEGTTLLAMADFLGGDLRVTAPLVGVDEVAIGDLLVVRSGAAYDFVLAPAGDSQH